jgi:putative transposase
MDFMGDTLASGRTFRTLNIVDDASRECLAIEVDHGLSGLRVIRVLDRLTASRLLPGRIVVDNGPEFTSTALDARAYRRGVALHFNPAPRARGQRLQSSPSTGSSGTSA